MTHPLRLGLVLVAFAALPLSAQSTGGIIGKVIDATNQHPVRGVQIRVDAGRYLTTTDTGGSWRILYERITIERLSLAS